MRVIKRPFISKSFWQMLEKERKKKCEERGKEREREGKTERKTLLFTIKLQNNTFFYIYLTFKASTDGM